MQFYFLGSEQVFPLLSNPVIEGNTIFFGSSDGKVYSINLLKLSGLPEKNRAIIKKTIKQQND